MKKVLVFLADGFEEIEALTPVDYLRRAGAEVTVAATGKAQRQTEGAHGINVTADITLDAWLDANAGQLPDAVVVPGGMPGTKNIAACTKALSIITAMEKEKRLICAICAAPALVLSKTDALNGKKWTCYPGMQDNAEPFLSGYTDKAFVKDGNLITGRGPGAAEEFSMEIVRTLFGEETARKIKEASVQR
ncbi:MAG: DJ-1/PfpI family protein [Treponema sp.]|nr:DJ-1/PfpI family protein [Treponema sp.]